MSIMIDSLASKMASVVKAGKVYEVGFPHEPGIPHALAHPPFLYSMVKMHNDAPIGNSNLSAANDIITTGTHTGTHIDAIGHVSCDGYLHDGVFVDEAQDKGRGLNRHSIDEVHPIIRRGVLLDVARYKGVSHLDPAYPIGAEDLSQTAARQGVTIEKGDAVLIHTGWGQYFHQPRKYISSAEGNPGPDEEGARWLLEQGMELAGGDTFAFEVTPSHALPVHRLLLVEHGIPIVEALNLTEIAEDQVYTFLFVCLPLRITGGTGSPIRPIAIC